MIGHFAGRCERSRFGDAVTGATLSAAILDHASDAAVRLVEAGLVRDSDDLAPGPGGGLLRAGAKPRGSSGSGDRRPPRLHRDRGTRGRRSGEAPGTVNRRRGRPASRPVHRFAAPAAGRGDRARVRFSGGGPARGRGRPRREPTDRAQAAAVPAPGVTVLPVARRVRPAAPAPAGKRFARRPGPRDDGGISLGCPTRADASHSTPTPTNSTPGSAVAVR